ncbi:MAG TPA: hypothetical protein DCE78_00590 [Bacteroidetes bacterium]|nr:hypothetical protein [Bacteroidota bacterium]
MPSRIINHFPVVQYRDGLKYLFNPVTKQWLVDRPEERVRLRTIEFLTREAGFSLNRMNTEQGLQIGFGGASDQRTDIVCFDSSHQPLLLVECKSESIRIDEKTVIQGARYNRSVKAPYVMLTNGITDVLIATKEGDEAEIFKDWQRISGLHIESVRDFSYWQKRGMWGSGADGFDHGLHEVLSGWLTRFWTDEAAQNQYIQVKIPDYLELEVPKLSYNVLSHYFRVLPREDDGSRKAISIIGGTKNEACAIMIDARSGKEPIWSVMEVNLSDVGSLQISNSAEFRHELDLRSTDNAMTDILNLII